MVYTHGANGEYGHNRHIETHRAVLRMARSDEMKCKSLFTFDYLRKEEPFMCEPNPAAESKFALSDVEHEKKKYLIRDVYGFSEQSFEFLSCVRTECFRKVF